MANNSSGGMNKITVWFIVGFLVLVTVGVIVAGAISGGSSSNPNANFVATTAPAITSTDWTMGPQNAKVTLTEYGDFECPACGEYYPVVTQLLQQYGNQVLFVFRNFPLYSIHPDAGIAAQAAEAAGVQGKFWDMYNKLYQTQNTWTLAAPGAVVAQYFNGYAQTLGLNVPKFDADINSSQVMSKIQTDVNGANSASVDHTPTFFINNTQIPNPASFNEFKTDIDQALAAAGVGTSTTGSASGTPTITQTSTPAGK